MVSVEPHPHGQHEQDPRRTCSCHPRSLLLARGQYNLDMKKILNYLNLRSSNIDPQILMIIQVLAGWLQIYRGTKYSRFPRFVIIIVVYHHYFVYQSLHGHLVFHHLLINIVIPELSFLLLQVSGLLASYEKTTCKCVMEVITYWSHKQKKHETLGIGASWTNF